MVTNTIHSGTNKIKVCSTSFGLVTINKMCPLVGYSLFGSDLCFLVLTSSEYGLVMPTTWYNTSLSWSLLLEGSVGLQPLLIESMSSCWSIGVVMHSVDSLFVRVLRWSPLGPLLGPLSLAVVLENALRFRPANWSLVCLVRG